MAGLTAPIDLNQRLYRAAEKDRKLYDPPLAERQFVSAPIQDDTYHHLRTRAVVNRRVGQGATGEGAVQGAIAAAENRMA